MSDETPKCPKCGSPLFHDKRNEAIRALMEKYPWIAQKDLAPALGLSTSRISQIKRGA